MTDVIDWDAVYAGYQAAWDAMCRRARPHKPFVLPSTALPRLAIPTAEDVRWLTLALKDDGSYPMGKKWLVAEVARAVSMNDALLEPMLDAAVEETNPSNNRLFVEPCMEAFGPRRVNEYLLSVLERGTDVRKAGAARALYWAQVGLVFPGGTPSFDDELATQESRDAYALLDDVWKRKRQLLLEVFVTNSSVEVRRWVIPGLNLNPAAYPESHRPLVTQAIAIARAHDDEYIRHRVEIQLSD
jgi:hypothetical protein